MGLRITTTVAVFAALLVPAFNVAADPGVMGVVGCSNTGQHAWAYQQESSEDRLTRPRGLGGGTPWAWMRPGSRYFPEYDSLRPAGGYSQVWVQVCMREREHGGVFDQAEQDIITDLVTELRSRDPGVEIIMSPLNYYTTDSCASVGGISGHEVIVDTVEWAVTHLSVTRGPDTGPLSPAMLRGDGCHIDGPGFDLVGAQMVAWFDQPPTTTTTIGTTTTQPVTTTTRPHKCDLNPDHPRCLRYGWPIRPVPVE